MQYTNLSTIYPLIIGLFFAMFPGTSKVGRTYPASGKVKMRKYSHEKWVKVNKIFDWILTNRESYACMFQLLSSGSAYRNKCRKTPSLVKSSLLNLKMESIHLAKNRNETVRRQWNYSGKVRTEHQQLIATFACCTGPRPTHGNIRPKNRTPPKKHS